MKKQNLMTMVIAMMVFFMALPEVRAAIIVGIQIDIGQNGPFSTTSGIDVNDPVQTIYVGDISATTFTGSRLILEFDSDLASIIQNAAYELDRSNNGPGVDIGDIDDENIGPATAFSSVHIGFLLGGAPAVGLIESTSISNYQVVVSGAALDSFLASALVNEGDVLNLSGKITTGGNDYFTSGSVSVIPEPSAAILGSIGILALLRRKR